MNVQTPKHFNQASISAKGKWRSSPTYRAVWPQINWYDAKALKLVRQALCQSAPPSWAIRNKHIAILFLKWTKFCISRLPPEFAYCISLGASSLSDSLQSTQKQSDRCWRTILETQPAVYSLILRFRMILDQGIDIAKRRHMHAIIEMLWSWH